MVKVTVEKTATGYVVVCDECGVVKSNPPAEETLATPEKE